MKFKFLLFIFLFVLFYPNLLVNASEANTVDHYYEVECFSNDDLYNNGYQYVSGEVDFNTIGTYQTTHLNQNTEIVYVNNHIIEKVNNNSIQYKFNYLNDLTVPNNYTLLDIFYLENNDFYVVAKYEEVDATYYDQECIAVLFYNDFTLTWTYHYSKYSYFSNAYLVGDNLVVGVNIYNENDDFNTSIGLFEITKTREIIKDEEYKGEAKAILYYSFIKNNYIYLIINTSCNTLTFKDLNPLKINNIIILKLNYNNFKVIESITLSNDISMSIYYVKLINDKLYLIINDLTNKNYKKIIVNLISNDFDIYSFNKNISFIYNIFLINNKIYYLLKSNEKNILLDEDSKDIYEFDVNFDDIKILNESNNYIYFYTLKGKKINNLIKFDGNIINYDLNFESMVSDIKYFEEYFLVLSNNKIYDFNFIEFIYENSNDKVDKLFAINTKLLDVNYEENNANENMYGTYYNYKQYKTNKIVVNYKLKREVQLNTNVIHHSTYDKGFVLYFNGDGMIGNTKIESGYVCNDIGNYSLEITGVNNQKIIYNFTIDNLTVMPKEKHNLSFEFTNYKIPIVYTKGEVTNNINIVLEVRPIINIGITLSIVIISIVITYIVFIINKRRKEKCDY